MNTKQDFDDFKSLVDGLHRKLQCIPLAKRKVLLRGARCATTTNCWWFVYGIAQPIIEYLSNIESIKR